MKYFVLANLVLIGTTVSVSAQSQPDAPKRQEPRLESVFIDRFSIDSRGTYKSTGDVTWEAGKLTLDAGASLEREINGSSWAEVEVDFGQTGWAAGEDAAELQIWFLLQGATNCYVRLCKAAGAEENSSVALVDTGEEDGKPVTQVVREMAIAPDTIRRCTVVYRDGLVVISANGSEILTSFIENRTATVRGGRLASRDGSYGINGWQVASLPSPPPLTQKQQRLAAEVESATRVFFGSFHQEQFDEAVKAGQLVLQLRKELIGEKHRDYATSLNNLAIAYQSLGDYSSAKPLFQQARDVLKDALGEAHPNYAESLNNLARLYVSTGEYARAEPFYLEARDIWKKVLGEEHPSYAKCLNNLASLYESTGEYARAEPLHLQAQGIWKNAGWEEHPLYALSLGDLARLYKSTGEYARAEPLYLQSAEIFRKVLGEEHPNYAAILNELASLYKSMGKYSQTESMYLRAQKILKKTLGEEHPIYATSLNELAGLLKYIGEYARAEQLYLQARDIYRNVLGEEHLHYAASLHSLAGLYKLMGEYARAEPLYLQARDIRKKVLGEAHPDYATTLNSLAGLYKTMGDRARAESLYRQALDIDRETLGEEHPDYATRLNNLANLYESMGEYAQAEQLYLQARDIFEQSLGEEHPFYATSLGGLAGLYESMGAYSKAKPLYQQARDIRKRVLGGQHPDYARSLNNLAALHESMGEYSSAEPLYLQARDIWKQVLGEDHPDYATSVTNLSSLYHSIGEYGRAETCNLEALEVLTSGATRALPALSDVQARGWMLEQQPRVDLLLTSFRRLQKWNSPDAYAAVWETKGMISRLRVGQTMPTDASPAARQVFAELRDARLELAKLVSATPDQVERYRQALSAASEQKETLEKRLAQLNDASAQELAVRDAKVEDLLERLPSGIAVVDFVRLDDWNFLDREINIKDEDGNKETRTVKKEVARPVYDAFVLRSDRSPETNPAMWVPLGAAEPIDDSIASWRRKFVTTDKTIVNDSAMNRLVTSPEQRLRKLIWDKLEPHLEDIHTVVVIPDGNLHRLPWAALPGSKKGEYLIEEYALTTAASGQRLYGTLAYPSVETTQQLLAVGGIDYDTRPQLPSADRETKSTALSGSSLMRSQNTSGWRRLPGTEAEAAAIVGLWGDLGTVEKLGNLEANEYALARLLPESRFAHLATHGFFDTRGEVYGKNLRKQSLFESSLLGSQQESSVAYRNPLLMTGIVMAGANVPPEKDDLGLPVGDDGILTAEEISSLDLRNTELVTLSACETGLGDIAAGQGVFGLQRALHQAGVRTTVASLWKVNDAATQALMIEFYRNLWENGLSKVEALRQAQLTMLDRYDAKNGTLRGLGSKSVKVDLSKQPPDDNRVDPRFWAAFQLSGDWR